MTRKKMRTCSVHMQFFLNVFDLWLDVEGQLYLFIIFVIYCLSTLFRRYSDSLRHSKCLK
jgi:hypothetical protein